MPKKPKKTKLSKQEAKELAESRHIFLMLIPYDIISKFFRPFRGVSARVGKAFPTLGEDLKKTKLSYSKEDYLTAGFISYFVFACLFALIIFLLTEVRELEIQQQIVYTILSFVAIFLVFLILLLRMPAIQARSLGEEHDKYLLYALKDVELQIRAGTPLFDALKSVSTSGYGIVSKEFEKVTRRVSVGISMKAALERMISETDSDYLKKSGWQMINSLRAGADLRSTLASIIQDLNNAQKNKIMNYARELNLWSLVYMMFAVAIPTIGSTMMVILSTFAGFGINQVMFVVFVTICFVIQFVLVNLVKTRRPTVQF